MTENTHTLKCPLCGEEINRHNIEEKESEIPVFKTSYDFGGDISTLTEQRTKLLEMPCGCNIKTT